MKYVMLLSSSYSGSTLLSMVMCSHPDVAGFGDTYPIIGIDYDDAYCTCGAKLAECPVRKNLEDKMRGHGFIDYSWANSTPFPGSGSRLSASAIFLHRALPDFLRPALFGRFYRENHAYFESMRELSGCKCYFDGSKSLSRLELLRNRMDDVMVVHLIRDPRDYMASCLGKKHRKNKNYKTQMLKWITYNRLAHNYERKLGKDRYRMIYYRDLASRPQDTVSSLYEMAGLAPTGRDVNDVDMQSIHVVGNRMRKTFSGIEHHADTWKETLNDKVVTYINRKTSELDWLEFQGEQEP